MELLQTAKELENALAGLELCKAQAERAGVLREKLQSKALSVAVIGQFKRGKTTFVNRLIEEDILPTGIVPITAASTRISYGKTSADVVFENGSRKSVDAKSLHVYISEQENHDNEMGVSEVILRTEAPFLEEGIELVDTPGVGSVHEKNSKAAYDYAEKCDAVVFMLSVDSPINKIETDFLEKVKKYAGKFYFCVNKTDMIDEEDLTSYMEYCRSILEKLLGNRFYTGGTDSACGCCADLAYDTHMRTELHTGDWIKLYPVSAKTGFGMEEFRQALTEDLKASGSEIIEESVRLKLVNLITGVKGQISSYRTVLNMPPNVFRSRFEEMDNLLAERHLMNVAAGSIATSNSDNGEARVPATNQDNEETGASATKQDNWEARIPAIALNEERLFLLNKVRRLFGIEYYVHMEEPQPGATLSRNEFALGAEALYMELKETLNTIFMYKEENAYTVARRIEDMNILIRSLEKYRKQLEVLK